MAVSLTPKEIQLLIAVCGEVKGEAAKVNWNGVASRVNIKHGYHAKAGFKNLVDKKLANGTITLTAKETQLVIAAFQEMSDTSGIDFNNVAKKINIKHRYHAKAALKNLVEKKLSGHPGAQSSGGNAGITNTVSGDGDSDDDDFPNTPKKRSPKKKVGKRVTPIKASAGGPKTPRKSKKQAVPKYKTEEDDDDKIESDEAAMLKEYNSRSFTPSGDQENIADQEQEDTVSAQIYSEESCEAAQMGLSVEEYRKLSAEELHQERERAPTPGFYNPYDEVV